MYRQQRDKGRVDSDDFVASQDEPLANARIATHTHVSSHLVSFEFGRKTSQGMANVAQTKSGHARGERAPFQRRPPGEGHPSEHIASLANSDSKSRRVRARLASLKARARGNGPTQEVDATMDFICLRTTILCLLGGREKSAAHTV
eukprot:scaffold2884_cov363-Pavlova_lutheri.AAC.4